MIEPADLPPEILESAASELPAPVEIMDEKARLLEALHRARGNRSLAARHLGIGGQRSTAGSPATRSLVTGSRGLIAGAPGARATHAWAPRALLRIKMGRSNA